MGTTDGLTDTSATIVGGKGPHQGTARYPGSAITATGNLTLTLGYTNMLRIDPGGSARDVTLPAEAGAEGAWFEILNTADGAENLVVKNDGGSTIVTISQNEKATVVCNGTAWVHMGIVSVALS